ncbi:MAG: Nif11-like leader peptide family RiPP precursor [Desulfohalobiaceae bacterium]
MSKESAKAFMDRIAQDQDFAQKCSDCSNIDETMNLAKQEGYDFTEQEIKQAKEEAPGNEADNVAVRVLNKCLLPPYRCD